MRRHRTFYGLLALGAINGLVAIACTSGVGAPATIEAPYDRPPDSRDKPNVSTESPAISGRDTPTGALDNPGAQGGGPVGTAGGANGCPPCNGTFKCTTTAGTSSVNSTLVLKQVGSDCQALDSKGKVNGSLSCTGAVLDESGKNLGTWQAAGADAFTVATSETSSKGTVIVTTTCSKQSDSTTPIPPPPPTPTATDGTGTATPGPTPTPIVDAGTSG